MGGCACNCGPCAVRRDPRPSTSRPLRLPRVAAGPLATRSVEDRADDTDFCASATVPAVASGPVVARRLRLRVARGADWFVASDPRCLPADIMSLALAVAFWEVVTDSACWVDLTAGVAPALVLPAPAAVGCFFEAATGVARGLGPAPLGPAFDTNSDSCRFRGMAEAGIGEALLCFFAAFTGCCAVPWAEAVTGVSAAGFGLLAADGALDLAVGSPAAPAVDCAAEPAWWAVPGFAVCDGLLCLWPAWWNPESMLALGRPALW